MGIGGLFVPTDSPIGMSRIYYTDNAASYLGGMQGGRLFGAPLAVSLWHTVSLFKEKWCGEKSPHSFSISARTASRI